MIDPRILCNPPGRTRDDPGFVPRDYGTHRKDNAARLLFWRVAVFLSCLWACGAGYLLARCQLEFFR